MRHTEGPVKTETAVGGMQAQAKDHQGFSWNHLVPRKGKDEFFPGASRGSVTQQHLDFGLLTSRAVREYFSAV